MEFKLTPEEARELWIEALESGEYLQGQGYLRTSSKKFCCLGVACDLFRKVEGAGAWDSKHGFVLNRRREDMILPEEVQEWLGLSSKAAAYTDPGTYGLAGHNDAGITFKEIADMIRKAPGFLFKEQQ